MNRAISNGARSRTRKWAATSTYLSSGRTNADTEQRRIMMAAIVAYMNRREAEDGVNCVAQLFHGNGRREATGSGYHEVSAN